MIRCRHARHPRRSRSFDRHRRPAYKTGWPSCRRRGIRAPSASNAHPESQSEASSQPARFRPDYRRFMHPAPAPVSRAARWHGPKPSTLLPFHHLLRKRKYRRLFSSQRGRRPGAKGPAQELIDAVVAMKRRNPTWGCPRIAQQMGSNLILDDRGPGGEAARVSSVF